MTYPYHPLICESLSANSLQGLTRYYVQPTAVSQIPSSCSRTFHCIVDEGKYIDSPARSARVCVGFPHRLPCHAAFQRCACEVNWQVNITPVWARGGGGCEWPFERKALFPGTVLPLALSCEDELWPSGTLNRSQPYGRESPYLFY